MEAQGAINRVRAAMSAGTGGRLIGDGNYYTRKVSVKSRLCQPLHMSNFHTVRCCCVTSKWTLCSHSVKSNQATHVSPSSVD